MFMLLHINTEYNLSNIQVTEEAKKPQAATKEKKEAKKTKPAEGAPKKPASTGAEQETNADVDIGLIDLRVGRIVDVSKHPDADSLYVEQVRRRFVSLALLSSC